MTCADRARELNAVKDAADVEERAQDDFDYRVFDTPAAKLLASLESFLAEDLAQALVARTKYKDIRRELSLNTKKVQDMEAHPVPFGDFARTISLFTRSDWSDQVPKEVADMIRRLMRTQIVDPAVAQLPWLGGQLKVMS